MQKLSGIAVSPGVAIGEAFVLDNEGFRISRRFIARETIDAELQRLAEAFEETRRQTERNRDAVATGLGKQYASIFEAHLMMLGDPRLWSEIEESIRERSYSPEYATSRVLRRYAKVLQSLDSDFLAERSNDIVDIERRLLQTFLGKPQTAFVNLTAPVLVLAHNPTPSQTAGLDRRHALGLVPEVGRAASPPAILHEHDERPG